MGEAKTDPDARNRLNRTKEDWIERVSDLADEVSRWCAAENWAVERHDRPITERLLGAYIVPELSIRPTTGEILLIPVGLHVAGGNGRVDIEAIPTLARVKLIDSEHGWTLFADTNVPLRSKWNRRNFVQLVQDLLS